MYQIINAHDFEGGIDMAAKYIHDKWGSDKNYPFYYDCIIHSGKRPGSLPRFYLMIKNETIVGCFALLTNDLISRQDLMPWFACLFIDEAHRGNRLSELMFHHAEQEMSVAGFENLYLATDHQDLYEKFSWLRIEDGYDFFGNKFLIYKKPLNANSEA